MLFFLSENKIFSEAQNGLRKGKCIDTTVQAFTERIQQALDERDLTTGIFIELTKAYDILNHKSLLEELPCCGIKAVLTYGLGLI
jgi:hypothetical protein